MRHGFNNFDKEALAAFETSYDGNGQPVPDKGEEQIALVIKDSVVKCSIVAEQVVQTKLEAQSDLSRRTIGRSMNYPP